MRSTISPLFRGVGRLLERVRLDVQQGSLSKEVVFQSYIHGHLVRGSRLIRSGL